MVKDILNQLKLRLDCKKSKHSIIKGTRCVLHVQCDYDIWSHSPFIPYPFRSVKTSQSHKWTHFLKGKVTSRKIKPLASRGRKPKILAFEGISQQVGPIHSLYTFPTNKHSYNPVTTPFLWRNVGKTQK